VSMVTSTPGAFARKSFLHPEHNTKIKKPQASMKHFIGKYLGIKNSHSPQN
jgi:hypothetical protein